MGLGNSLIHHGWHFFDSVAQIPTVWPFIFILPVFIGIGIAQHERFPARAAAFTRPLILVGSILTLLATFRIAVSYLSTNFILNTYSTLFSETSWLLYQGQPIYSSFQTPEHDSIPYGPFGYVLVGFCQHLLGPGMFSSKLAPFLATVGSSIFLYLALRTRVEWLCALALTALVNALELPLEPFQLWPRPEPFLLLAVSAGLWAATRRGIWGPILLGFCLGFAADIKIYAFAFFFMAIVVAWRQHKSWMLWTLAAVISSVTFFAPFASPAISLRNYVALLKMMDAGRVFKEGLAIPNFEWAVVLGIIALAPFLIVKREASETKSLFWKNADLLGALLLSCLVVSHPAGLEGSGPHQLLPFIPVFIYLAAHLWGDASILSKPYAQPMWNWPGLAMTLSMVIFISGYALLQGIRQPKSFEESDSLAKARIADIGQILNERMPCLLLNAAGSDATREDNSYRAILVYNGMPIGIDATPTADYESLGYSEPDLPGFVSRLQSRYNLPIYWICPKGTVPFSETSYFGSRERIFSNKFVDDFHQYFQPSGSTTCFDLYELKTQ